MTLQLITSTARRGAEVFATDLEAALRVRGRSVRTVALVPASEIGATLDVPTLGHRRIGASTLRRLRREMREEDVTVGHGSSTLPAAAIASFGSDLPFVYRNVGDPMYWGTSAARRARVRLFLHRARVVVALTMRTADALTDRYAVPARKIRVIPKGVPGERFPEISAAAREQARRHLGLPDGEPVYAYVGALSAEKDPTNAIRGFARLSDGHLLIAGDGAERASLEALAEELAPGRVTFLGAVDEPAKVYAAADALVLSSRTEGLPGVLMEAGLSGLPVVTTDVGFVREIVRDGETGLVVPADDPVALGHALAEVIDARAALGRAARAHCLAHFEIGQIAQQWDALLTDVASGTAP